METLIRSFFDGFGIMIEGLTVEQSGEDLSIDLKTPDSHLLIGMHGKNLESIQHILGRMLEKQSGKFLHVHLEINDYMKSKDERLFRFLDNKIQFALETGKVIKIPNMTAFERKKAHRYISEKHIAGLSTKSEGEGGERVMVLTYTGEIQTKRKESSQTGESSSLSTLSLEGVGI